jgi:hypothetical protein
MATLSYKTLGSDLPTNHIATVSGERIATIFSCSMAWNLFIAIGEAFMLKHFPVQIFIKKTQSIVEQTKYSWSTVYSICGLPHLECGRDTSQELSSDQATLSANTIKLSIVTEFPRGNSYSYYDGYKPTQMSST